MSHYKIYNNSHLIVSDPGLVNESRNFIFYKKESRIYLAIAAQLSFEDDNEPHLRKGNY